MDYLKQLNPEQLKAATTTEGFIRVVAGAGSGKTKTLSARYLYLVDQLGISTANILCVTFTNKAAAEMKKRIRSLLPDQDLGRITTFHGFCVGLLKEDCHVIQYPTTFIILDEEDKEGILRQVFEDLGITSRDMTIKEAVDHIGWRKGGRGYVKTLTGDAEKLRTLSEGIFPGKRANTREKLEEERRLCYVAFTRARDRLFLSDAAGTNYDGSFRYPSRFLFNAEKENVEYVVPLDPETEERTQEQIRQTENCEARSGTANGKIGKRVVHPVFGEGIVIGIPRGQEGVIVQFAAMETPRTLGPTVKLAEL